ncbi:hypothetical protein U8527_15805 [Kordia algicida OT-1]|uniref:Lipoprotein n=1 Tax=Kordia algicida OT-1 TaxID=391587 RepID=A9E3X1_9FLAO|nr:hypothetical protein [Kordia algicida]EDP95283.1 hypothetical protein KAOT1_09431 [Kordia algicida OT-1]
MKIVRKLFHFLCIFVLLIIFSCQDDTFIETQQEEILQTKPTIKSSTLFKKDLENNVKLNAKMNSLSTFKNQQIGKNVYNDTYNFTIETNVAKFVEDLENDTHSYTFAVHRMNNSVSTVENVVFSYDTESDTYEASLVTYLFSASQKEEYLQNGYITTAYDIHYEAVAIDSADILQKNSLPCTVTYQEFHIPNGSSNSHLYSTNGHIQNQCEHENDDDNPCDTYTVIDIYCPDGGSSSTGNATDDNTSSTTNANTSSTGGGNNTTTNSGDSGGDATDNIITSIITREENVKQSILECINGLAQFNTVDMTTIDPEILNLNNLTLTNWITINNYLQDNGCNENSQEQIITQLIDVYDDYQVINELEGKALCVYNKLKSSSVGFKNSIKKFDGDFPVAHLKLIEEDLGSTRGTTRPPINGYSPDYVITVVMNNNSTSQGINYRPNLLVAKTLVHEILHAEMFRKLMSLINQGNFDLITEEELEELLENGDFPGIYDYYRRYKNWQHAQMATHYRKSLARILQEFDTGISVPDNQEPQQLYLDLSWEGLRYDNIPAWVNLPLSEKNRIDTVISNYITNNTNETCTQ